MSVDQRLRAIESGLAVAQEAVASLAHRIAALEGAVDATGTPSPAAEQDTLLNDKHSTQHQIRGGGGMTVGTQNWRLILAAARALTAAGQSPFPRIAVYQWIWWRHSQARSRSTNSRPYLPGHDRECSRGTPERRWNSTLPRRTRPLCVGRPGKRQLIRLSDKGPAALIGLHTRPEADHITCSGTPAEYTRRFA